MYSSIFFARHNETGNIDVWVFFSVGFIKFKVMPPLAGLEAVFSTIYSEFFRIFFMFKQHLVIAAVPPSHSA